MFSDPVGTHDKTRNTISFLDILCVCACRFLPFTQFLKRHFRRCVAQHSLALFSDVLVCFFCRCSAPSYLEPTNARIMYTSIHGRNSGGSGVREVINILEQTWTRENPSCSCLHQCQLVNCVFLCFFEEYREKKYMLVAINSISGSTPSLRWLRFQLAANGHTNFVPRWSNEMPSCFSLFTRNPFGWRYDRWSWERVCVCVRSMYHTLKSCSIHTSASRLRSLHFHLNNSNNNNVMIHKYVYRASNINIDQYNSI